MNVIELTNEEVYIVLNALESKVVNKKSIVETLEKTEDYLMPKTKSFLTDYITGLEKTEKLIIKLKEETKC